MAFQMQRASANCVTTRKALAPVAFRRPQALASSAKNVVNAMTLTETQTLVQTIASTDFHTFLQAHAGHLTVVDFFTPMCGPCKVMAPVLEQWSQEYSANQVVFAKVDCSADPGNRKLAMELGVKALPTFFIYKGQQVVAKTTGSGINKLKKAIEDAMTVDA